MDIKRKLCSNFPRGSCLWSVRNAQWQALGLSEADCGKPKIAAVNSSSELASCFSHLDAVAREIKAPGARPPAGASTTPWPASARASTRAATTASRCRT